MVGKVLVLKEQIMRCTAIAAARAVEIVELVKKSIEKDSEVRAAKGKIGFAQAISSSRITSAHRPPSQVSFENFRDGPAPVPHEPTKEEKGVIKPKDSSDMLGRINHVGDSKVTAQNGMDTSESPQKKNFIKEDGAKRNGDVSPEVRKNKKKILDSEVVVSSSPSPPAARKKKKSPIKGNNKAASSSDKTKSSSSKSQPQRTSSPDVDVISTTSSSEEEEDEIVVVNPKTVSVGAGGPTTWDVSSTDSDEDDIVVLASPEVRKGRNVQEPIDVSSGSEEEETITLEDEVQALQENRYPQPSRGWYRKEPI
jgi:hypothetical protein